PDVVQVGVRVTGVVPAISAEQDESPACGVECPLRAVALPGIWAIDGLERPLRSALRPERQRPDLVEELVAALEIPVLSGGDHISVALAIVGGGVASSWARRRSPARERGPGAIDGERGSGRTQNDENQGCGQREMLATSAHRATSMARSRSSVRGPGLRTSAQTYREKLARSGRPGYGPWRVHQAYPPLRVSRVRVATTPLSAPGRPAFPADGAPRSPGGPRRRPRACTS